MAKRLRNDAAPFFLLHSPAKATTLQLCRPVSCLILLICIFLFSLTLCSPSERPVVIRIGILNSVDILPYPGPRAKGFDRAEGLQLQETKYDGGAAMIA